MDFAHASEIVKDQPGVCDICGMDLVSAESLGYTPTDEEEAPLIIPETAALITGKRAVVYVALPDKNGVFEGREIVLGPRAGDYFVVKDGLSEGEMVVSRGNFKIDSELQIRAKKSMMYHESNKSLDRVKPIESVKTDPEFLASLDPSLLSFFAIQQGLSEDDLDKARAAAKELAIGLGAIKTERLLAKALSFWSEHVKTIRNNASELSRTRDLAGARAVFEPLSNGFYALLQRFGRGGDKAVYRFYCPMAFDDRGAYWLQDTKKLANPYFGAEMLRCGSQTEVIGSGLEGDRRHD